jgi:hypothetical protein
VSAVKYELGFYIPEDGILHSHRHQNLRSYLLKPPYFRESCRTALCTLSGSSSVITLLTFRNLWIKSSSSNGIKKPLTFLTPFSADSFAHS